MDKYLEFWEKGYQILEEESCEHTEGLIRIQIGRVESGFGGC